MVAKRKPKLEGKRVGVLEVEPGQIAMLNGAWRKIESVEPYERGLDAYRTIHTADGKRLTRNIFDTIRVKGDADAS